MALVAILRGVPSELKATLAVKVMAKEEWVAVKTMCVGEDCVKATSRQRLLKEFENLQFKDGELIDNFAVRINTLVSGLLRELGVAVKDRRMVRKVLHVVPKKWKQVAVSIEMLLDLDQTAQKDAVPEAVFSDRHQASWRDQGLGGGMLHTPALACTIKFQLVQLTRVHDPEISEGCACLQELSTHVASTSCTERAWSWDGAAAMVFMPHI